VLRVVNDCGSKDNVLLLSQFFVLFTGMAGRTGFSGATNEHFRNRYSTFGHSGYFDGNSYMEARWLPLLMRDQPLVTFDYRPAPSIIDGIVIVLANNAEPIKIIFYSLPFMALSHWMILQRDAALASAFLAQAQLERSHTSEGQLAILKRAIASDTLAPTAQAKSLAMSEVRLLPERLIFQQLSSFGDLPATVATMSAVPPRGEAYFKRW
jgi:hypothetical protein